jgi:hypothetical protein
MWTETTEGREFISEVSKDIVAKVAPEELDLFDELMGEYFENPTPPSPSNTKSDKELGFGVAEVLLPPITVVAAAVVKEVLNYISTKMAKVLQDKGPEAIKAIFKHKNEKKGPLPLTKEQLAEVKKLAIKVANRDFGLDLPTAQKMALELVGQVTLAD